ncbi:MAG: FtsX-like permease family protein [Bacteroidota bacterium]
MMILKLAFRNLLGAGMKTWLNVIVLSLSFVIIIFYNGMIDGWNQQARKANIDWSYASGQWWQAEYDPYDPFTLQDAHAPIPTELAEENVPQLLVQAAAYPQGRMQSVFLRGIPAEQTLLELPTASLSGDPENPSILLGKRMAETCGVQAGDAMLIRWRDKNGTFDAQSFAVADIFDSDVPTIDQGTIWLDLKALQAMTGLEGEATLIVVSDEQQPEQIAGWEFQALGSLTAEMDAIIQSKKGSAAVIYLMLLFIALLAIFDTQVLSVFRRQKEIGTYVALGMTRSRVVQLFTLEGGAISLLAAGVGAIYGVPLFLYFARTGFTLPANSDDYGITMAETIFPVYGAGLVLGTTLLVVIAATIVSYLPARKISHMRPTDALKGKLL